MDESWPPLPFEEWRETCDTLHMWTQVVGKTRLKLTPLVNHWWNVPLYVSPRGLNTSPIPYGFRTFEAEFDFIAHKLLLRTSGGAERGIGLYPRTVADFYAEYMSCLRSLDIEVRINTMPVEFADPIRFEQDVKHASYDKEYVERFREILIRSDRLLHEFRSRFLGKNSPVHFFWGSFDLTVTTVFRQGGASQAECRCGHAGGLFARSAQLRLVAWRSAIPASRFLRVRRARAGRV